MRTFGSDRHLSAFSWRVVAGVAMAAAWLSVAAAENQEKVAIEPFEGFGCLVEGKELLPSYSLAGRAEFRLPGQQEDCLDTIKRAVVACSWATRHEDSWNDVRYPQCLPIFRDQRQACAAHYRRQEAKCKVVGGGPRHADVMKVDRDMWAAKRSNLRSGPGTEHGKVGLLEVGEKVRVTGEIERDWLQIEMAGGGKAFVYAPLLANAAPRTAPAPLGPKPIYRKVTYKDGSRYRGEFRNGKRTGRGTFTWSNGDRYEGEWRNNKRTGRGTYTWPNGNRYEGEWRNNKRIGRGTLTWSNGNRYVGEFRNDERTGQGTFTWPSGHRYRGDFVNGARTGHGTYTWPNGNRYVGEFRNGKRTGWGKYTYADGSVEEGEWRNGKLVRLSERMARERRLEQERWEQEEWEEELEYERQQRRNRNRVGVMDILNEALRQGEALQSSMSGVNRGTPSRDGNTIE